jgi:hypothetical protein
MGAGLGSVAEISSIGCARHQQPTGSFLEPHTAAPGQQVLDTNM